MLYKGQKHSFRISILIIDFIVFLCTVNTYHMLFIKKYLNDYKIHTYILLGFFKLEQYQGCKLYIKRYI